MSCLLQLAHGERVTGYIPNSKPEELWEIAHLHILSYGGYIVYAYSPRVSCKSYMGYDINAGCMV